MFRQKGSHWDRHWTGRSRPTYLITALCIKQDPSKLDNLGRILGHVDAVLITGGGDVDNDIAVEIPLLAGAGRRHQTDGGCKGERKGSGTVAAK